MECKWGTCGYPSFTHATTQALLTPLTTRKLDFSDDPFSGDIKEVIAKRQIRVQVYKTCGGQTNHSFPPNRSTSPTPNPRCRQIDSTRPQPFARRHDLQRSESSHISSAACSTYHVHCTSFVGLPAIVSTDPDLNYMVFQPEGQLFQSWYPYSLRQIYGKQNVSTLHGYLKNMMLNPFGHGSLKNMLSDIERVATRNIERDMGWPRNSGVEGCNCRCKQIDNSHDFNSFT
ncbi:putative cytochrome P450 superfamily [Helianthus debilis subsp. tardiflorus]